MRAAGDRGSGTVLVLAVVAALGLVSVTAWTASAAALARHRAEVAADLAALAGAGELDRAGASDRACAAARAVAGANGAWLESCRVGGAQLVVVAALRLRLPGVLGGGSRVVKARARAGREPPPGAARRSRQGTGSVRDGPVALWRYRDICGPTSSGA